MMTKEEFLKKFIYESDKKFPYMLLDRMRADCEYFLGYGNRNARHLWANEGAETHIKYMKYIWEFLPEKPEWLTMEDIENYEKRMLN